MPSGPAPTRRRRCGPSWSCSGQSHLRQVAGDLVPRRPSSARRLRPRPCRRRSPYRPAARGPSTRAATGSSMPTWSRSSSRQSTRSASLPTSSVPSSSSRPRQRAPCSVPSWSASAHVIAAGPPRAARPAGPGAAAAESPASLEAAPSTPRPTGAPARTSGRTGAMPAPSRALDDGQCATPVPRLAEARDLARRTGARSARARRRRPASRAPRGTRPAARRTAPGRTPPPRPSRPCACAAGRRAARATSAVSAISSRVTLNGEQGASAIRQHRPRRRVVEARPAAARRPRGSCRGPRRRCPAGARPEKRPRSIAPRHGWKRMPSSRATSISHRAAGSPGTAREHVVMIGRGRAAGAQQRREPGPRRRALDPLVDPRPRSGTARPATRTASPAARARASPTGRGGDGS